MIGDLAYNVFRSSLSWCWLQTTVLAVVRSWWAMPFLCKYPSPATTSVVQTNIKHIGKWGKVKISIYKMDEIFKCVYFFFYAKMAKIKVRKLHHDGIGLMTKSQILRDISVTFDTMEDTGFLPETSFWIGGFNFQLLDANMALHIFKFKICQINGPKCSTSKFFFNLYWAPWGLWKLKWKSSFLVRDGSLKQAAVSCSCNPLFFLRKIKICKIIFVKGQQCIFKLPVYWPWGHFFCHILFWLSLA